MVPELVEGEKGHTILAAPSLREVGAVERASLYTLRQAQGPGYIFIFIPLQHYSVPELVEGEKGHTILAAPSLGEVGGGEKASFRALRQAQGPNKIFHFNTLQKAQG